MTAPRSFLTPPLLVALLALGTAADASARDRGGREDRDDRDDRVEVERAGTCEKGARSKLRVRARDGDLRVRFELTDRASGRKWKVVLVHERKVVARVTAKTSGDAHQLEVERTLTDLDGADEVRVRASGPGGRTCTANVTVPGSV
ncbi:MAG: hypothetical protein JHD16_09710 [Solirubrobacteraceae bacterium]|nr:hypothetical protein [Solirubrobacteraceae bacterium]